MICRCREEVLREMGCPIHGVYVPPASVVQSCGGLVVVELPPSWGAWTLTVDAVDSSDEIKWEKVS